MALDEILENGGRDPDLDDDSFAKLLADQGRKKEAAATLERLI